MLHIPDTEKNKCTPEVQMGLEQGEPQTQWKEEKT